MVTIVSQKKLKVVEEGRDNGSERIVRGHVSMGNVPRDLHI
jgi:hypothetical protein